MNDYNAYVAEVTAILPGTEIFVDLNKLDEGFESKPYKAVVKGVKMFEHDPEQGYDGPYLEYTLQVITKEEPDGSSYYKNLLFSKIQLEGCIIYANEPEDLRRMDVPLP